MFCPSILFSRVQIILVKLKLDFSGLYLFYSDLSEIVWTRPNRLVYDKHHFGPIEVKGINIISHKNEKSLLEKELLNDWHIPEKVLHV